jgi:hypothetical protein
MLGGKRRILTKKNKSISKKAILKRKQTKKIKKCLSYEDVDYATDIDVLTIMSKKQQMEALGKVNAFLKCNKSKKNKSAIEEMIKRKQQISQLIKE